MIGPGNGLSPAEEFAQLRLKFIDPVQHDYEVIRPIVLYSETVAERSRQTEIERTQIGDKARRFVQQGMLGLVDQRASKAGRKAHVYPELVAAYILYLKRLYPPIHYCEIERIIKRKFGHKTNHHTLKRFLEQYPIPVQLPLNFTEFHDFEDAYQARWTVVKMYYEGWNKKSIAGCLKLSRKHVHDIIAAFKQDGFAGLEDQRTRPFHHPANQLTLPFLKEVLDVQREYPRAGRFRVRGLLEKQRDHEPPSERTIGRAMALNRQFHGAPGPWTSDKPDPKPDPTPKYLPYRPQYRHQIWFVDLRYLVKRQDNWVYSICIIEGYSRTILAGMAAEYQDLTAVLQILYAALSDYGCPELIVSDNGAVFHAHHYTQILNDLEIEPKYIEKGKPWQNLIEAQFKIQLRLAVFQFEQAQTLDEIQRVHSHFIETFNTTAHSAHQDRPDGRRPPANVLAWVRGRLVEPERLQRLFRQMHFAHSVNRSGFVSLQRFYLYAEPGLARQRIAIWIYEGTRRLEYQQTLLAQYQVEYDPHTKALQQVSQPRIFSTSFRSPQLALFELDHDQWLHVYERPYHSPKAKPTKPAARQFALISFSLIILVQLQRLWP